MAGTPAPRLLMPADWDAASNELLEAQSLILIALGEPERDVRNLTLGRAVESMRRSQKYLGLARPVRMREQAS